MIKCNTIKCETRASLIKNDKYYCAVCYREIFMEDKNNVWQSVMPCVTVYKIK